MKVFTKNEYSPLKSVLLGSVDNFAWPTDDEQFDKSIQQSDFGNFNYTVDNLVLEQARQDLNRLQEELDKRSINVIRPSLQRDNWGYSARDILFTYGDKMIQSPTGYSSRAHESELYKELDSVKIIEAPRPIDENDPMFDAANICKFNDHLLYLESSTGNRTGADWLQQTLDTEVIVWNGVYAFAHIDSTIASLNDDTIMVNAQRVRPDQIPLFLKDKKIIWVEQIIERSFAGFPFASSWIGMNVLSIDPETVIVDEIQTKLIKELQVNKFKVIALAMRQSRTLGGGFHCVTCDLERQP
jgi:N-dimethylarginine dimethylaminohydrolase